MKVSYVGVDLLICLFVFVYIQFIFSPFWCMQETKKNKVFSKTRNQKAPQKPSKCINVLEGDRLSLFKLPKPNALLK